MLEAAKSNKNLLSKVLLVEDNKVNQMVFIGMLNSFGFDVEIAEDGKQGVELWQQGKFDAVFMDIQMPVMDGLEATRRIRSVEAEGEHTLIIALTANAFLDDEKACMDAGMDAFLTKPLNLIELKDTLNTRLPSV